MEANKQTRPPVRMVQNTGADAIDHLMGYLCDADRVAQDDTPADRLLDELGLRDAYRESYGLEGWRDDY